MSHAIGVVSLPPPARHDVGLGTAYERWAVYELLKSWLGTLDVSTALEGPVDGMAGIPGLHLLPAAVRGARVTVVVPDAEAAEVVRGVYRTVGVEDRLDARVSDNWPEGTFDVVLTYNALPSVPDWKSHLGEAACHANRQLWVSVTHPASYGVFVRKALRLVQPGPCPMELFDHPSTKPGLLEPELRRYGSIVADAYVDCPWWPDLFVETGETLLTGTLSRLPFGRRFRRGPAAAPPAAGSGRAFPLRTGPLPVLRRRRLVLGTRAGPSSPPESRREPESCRRVPPRASSDPGRDAGMTPKMETGSSPGRPDRLLRRLLSPALGGLVVLGALWATVAFRFLDSPPGGDFVGDMYWVDLLSPHVLSGSLPAWNPGSALGHPLLIQRMNLMLFLPTIALKALVGSTEAAAKIYLLLGHTLSGLGFYYLARLYTRRRSAAAFAALLFLVAPVHVSELCLSGHWSVAQSYALSPVVLGLIAVTVREEARRGLFRALLLGGAAAWLAWADNERTATLVPLVILFAAYEVAMKDARTRYRAIGRLGLAAVVAACLSAGFLLPAFLDRKQLMLSGVTVPDFGFRFWNTSSPPFELWHPALAVDRLWSLSRLPFFSGMMHPIAHVHLGWIPILLAAGAVFQAVKSGGERRRLVLVLLASSLLLVQVSMGSNTILGSTYESLRPLVGATFAAAFLLLAALIVAGLLVRVFRKRGVRAGLAWTAGAIYLAVGAPYLILSRLPPFDSMRSTLWFLTINLPILLSLLAALFLDGIDLSEARSGRALIALAALAWLDLWAYLRVPVGLPPETTEMYRSVGQELDKDPDSFRFAWVPYETARPEEAYADRFTRKRDYGSWIYWCSGTWGGGRSRPGSGGFGRPSILRAGGTRAGCRRARTRSVTSRSAT